MFERTLLSSDSCAEVGALRPLLVAARQQHRTRTTALRPGHELSLSEWTRCRPRKFTPSGHNHSSGRLHPSVMRAAPNDPAPDTPAGPSSMSYYCSYPGEATCRGAGRARNRCPVRKNVSSFLDPWLPGPLHLILAEAFSPNLEGIVSSEKGQRDRRLERLRVSLLAALSSLDRGLAANAREAGEVDGLCSRLEALGGPVTLLPMGALSGGTDELSRGLLAGTWRLIYSSGFNSGSLGGRRPGPPAALFPTILGQVYQRIDPETAKLDNIVELLLNYGPPDLGLLGLGEEALGRGLTGLSKQLGMELKAEQLPAQLRDLLNYPAGEQQKQNRESPAARLTLRHDYEVTPPATLRIVYEETYGELVGSDIFAQLPRLQAPSLPEPLRPPKFLRSATFDVTFLDETLRITRGDRGELRVYLRDGAADAAFGGTERNATGAVALDYDD